MTQLWFAQEKVGIFLTELLFIQLRSFLLSLFHEPNIFTIAFSSVHKYTCA